MFGEGGDNGLAEENMHHTHYSNNYIASLIVGLLGFPAVCLQHLHHHWHPCSNQQHKEEYAPNALFDKKKTTTLQAAQSAVD